MNTAAFVARYLAARGVRHAFGHPGSDVMDLIEEMDRVGIRYVMTHHENTGAFMASAMGRLTGLPGVILVTKGPCVTNVATGVGSAYLDRAPLLVFSSTSPGVRQRVPVEFYDSITKLSAELTAENAPELLPRAVAIATSGFPGPAYLPATTAEQVREVPLDDADLEAIIARDPAADPIATDDGALVAIGGEVAGARRLVVVVGQGVEFAGAVDIVLDAVSALGAPVCVTPQAVGVIPSDHPQYAGMTGWHDAPVRALIGGADLVVTMGLDAADVMVPYRDLARVIHLAPTPADIRPYQPVAHALQGDLRELARHVGEHGRGARDWGLAEAAATRAAVERDVAVSTDHDEADGIAPQEIVTSLRAATPRDAIFVTDVGAHKIVAGVTWPSYEPRTFLMSNGFGSMGYGLGSALGAKLACPDRTVVAVVGDGGFLMYAGDLATWARLGLPMVLVVMVDNDLTQVQRRQERAGYDLGSTTFQSIDYCAVARTFGIDGVKVEDAAAYRTALDMAIAAGRPMLIEAMLDSSEYRRIPGWA
jgi:acetolactate synthase-1/2/3 large subunit